MEQLDKLYHEKISHSYAKQEIPETVHPLYGEISREGVEAVLENLKEHFSNPEAVFYDLGSGIGRMVFHVAISCPIKKAVGVEFIKSRHDQAVSNINEYNYSSTEKPEFINADISTMNFDNASIIYIDNTVSSFAELSLEIYNQLPKGCLFIARNYSMRLKIPKEDLGGEFLSSTTYIKSGFKAWYAIKG